MGNLKNIFEGWSKALGLREVSEADKELARARVKICVDCEHAHEHWLKKIIKGELQVDEAGSGIGCKLCGCPVNEKALVPQESCPVDKW